MSLPIKLRKLLERADTHIRRVTRPSDPVVEASGGSWESEWEPYLQLFHEDTSDAVITPPLGSHGEPATTPRSMVTFPWGLGWGGGVLLITWTLDRCGLAGLGECSSSLW